MQFEIPGLYDGWVFIMRSSAVVAVVGKNHQGKVYDHDLVQVPDMISYIRMEVFK